MGMILLPIFLFYLPLQIMGNFMDFFLPMKLFDKIFYGDEQEESVNADS